MITDALSGRSYYHPPVIDVADYGASPTNTPEANRIALDLALVMAMQSSGCIVKLTPGTYAPAKGTDHYMVVAEP